MDRVKHYYGKAKHFLYEAKNELKKVAWPTPKQTLASTSIVLIVVFVVSSFLGLVDFGLTKLVKWFLG